MGALVLAVFQVPFSVASTTYYIDSTAGKDDNSGTNSNLPWRTLAKVNRMTFSPGDQIRFRADRTWTGQLKPRGSGTNGAPIILDAYGGGAAPRINGIGIDGAAVYLDNVEYWEVQNLDISNPGLVDSVKRIGIQVNNENLATAHHIYLRHLNVHDVRGKNDFDTGKTSGGIQFNCVEGPISFDDVLIEFCAVHDVSRVGITVNGATDIAPATTVFGRNVKVRFNTIYNTGGDLIIIRLAKEPLIEHNVGHDFPTGGNASSFTVGMWCRSCVNAVFQYNEVYNSTATADGEAFDSDLYSDGTIFQYNYSHDNVGGFLLLMSSSTNNTARYNVSRNERQRIISISADICDNSKIYNNTFYIPPGANPTILGRSGTDNGTKHTYFNNNVVYNLGSGNYDTFAGLSADGNCFYGNHPSGEPADPHKITADPQLVNPGGGAIGFGTLNGYQLQPASPCIGAGVPIRDSGGRDFWGTPLGIGNPDIGACQHPMGLSR